MIVPQIGHVPMYSIKHFWINRRTAGKVNPEVFFIAHPFQHQKSIGQRHQRDMMMPPLPRAAFKMIQPYFPFHLLVILINTEASFGLSNQPSERSSMRRQTGKPVLPWFVRPLRPFDQQFFRWHLHRFALQQSTGHPDDHPSKTGSERSFGPFSPSDLFPTLRRQVFGNLTEVSSGRQALSHTGVSEEFVLLVSSEAQRDEDLPSIPSVPHSPEPRNPTPGSSTHGGIHTHPHNPSPPIPDDRAIPTL